MEIHPFFIFSVFIIIFILIVMKRFFSVPSAERKALAQAEEGKKLKEFALHHFNELKKLNPSATLEDDFPENVFPLALKNILKTDNPSREEQMEAIVAINVLFSQQQKTTDINYINKRVKVQRNSIFIDNSFSLRNRQIEIQPIIELEGEIPSISIYEGSKLIRKFNIEPLKSNPNLNGQYLHSSIRINTNSSVQIDGIISKSRTTFDENGKPIIVNGIRQVQEVDILFVDGPMYFVTDEAMLGYKKQAYEIIKDWVVDDIALIEDDLLDKTSINFYPETTLGKVDVYLSDNSETTIGAQQSFTIELYVDKAAYENETVRDVIRRATIAVLDKHVRSNEVNMGAVSNDLRAAYDTSVVTFVAKGLGGSVNYPIVRVKNGENRLCINKRAVAQPDGSIIIEDDVTLIFIPYNK